MHVNAVTGERPGFDPRMNEFPFSFTFLEDPLSEVELDVASVSGDIISVDRADPFTVDLLVNGSRPGSEVTFLGIPDQDPNVLSLIDWQNAILSLTGSARLGEIWTVTLDGTSFSSIDLTDIAIELATLVNGKAGLDLAATISGTVLTISGPAFTAELLAPNGAVIVTGTRAFDDIVVMSNWYVLVG